MRFCLKRSLKLQEVIEGCKSALIDAAADELAAKGERQTINRLSIMTGIHRADVNRLCADDEPEQLKTSANVVNRLIAQWQTDSRYLTAARKPRVLSFDGKKGEFAELIATISADPNPYSLLAELERIGSVEHTSRGVRLKTPEYIVRADPTESFTHLSQDSEDLIGSVEENIFSSGDPNLHLRTEYDKIPEQFGKEIRKWLLQEGSEFHAKIRNRLADYDLDTNPKLEGAGSFLRVAICSFSRMQTGQGEPPSQAKQVGKRKSRR